MSDNEIQALAQQGVEEFYDENQYEDMQELEELGDDPYAEVNSCDALRIIDGVVDSVEEL